MIRIERGYEDRLRITDVLIPSFKYTPPCSGSRIIYAPHQRSGHERSW